MFGQRRLLLPALMCACYFPQRQLANAAPLSQFCHDLTQNNVSNQSTCRRGSGKVASVEFWESFGKLTYKSNDCQMCFVFWFFYGEMLLQLLTFAKIFFPEVLFCTIPSNIYNPQCDPGLLPVRPVVWEICHPANGNWQGKTSLHKAAPQHHKLHPEVESTPLENRFNKN